MPFRRLFGKLQLIPAAFLLPECESDLLSDGRKGRVDVRVERYDRVGLQIPERVVGPPYVFGALRLECDVCDPYQEHVVDQYLGGIGVGVVVGYDYDAAVAADAACECAGHLHSEDLECLVAGSGEKFL